MVPFTIYFTLASSLRWLVSIFSTAYNILTRSVGTASSFTGATVTCFWNFGYTRKIRKIIDMATTRPIPKYIGYNGKFPVIPNLWESESQKKIISNMTNTEKVIVRILVKFCSFFA